MTPVFRGTVSKGALHVEAGFYTYLASLEGQPVEVVVRKKGSRRSTQANRYYWGVVVRLLSDHTGYDPDEMHDALKEKFLGAQERDEHGLVKIRSSAALSTSEFCQYTNKVVMWAADKLGVFIPSPDMVEY